MYDGYYNGNLVFFDTDVTDEVRKSILDIENDALDYSYDVSLEDKYFDDVPDRYKKLIPNVRYNDIREDLVNDINDATIKFINSIKAIENAIRDYCDGDGVISSENKATLDFYLAQSKPSLSDDTSDKYNNNNSSSGENEEFVSENVDISNSVNNDYDAKFSDEKIVIDQAVIVGSNISNVGVSSEGSTDISMLGDDFGNSLYSITGDFKNNFSFPMTSLNKNTDDNKNNMINYNDISMAAIAALSGKIIYDKQQETDDNISDSTINDSLNCEEHISDGMVLGTNSVEFKNDLLDGMIEVD